MFASTGCGNFLYFEASNVHPKSKSIFQSSLQQSRGDQCFSFHVSMHSLYRSEMGSLQVAVVDINSVGTTYWKHKGVLTENNYWKTVNINLHPNADFKVNQIRLKKSFCFLFFLNKQTI